MVGINNTELQNMTFDGQEVNTWIHNGIEVFGAIIDFLAIENSVMNTNYVTTLLRGAIGFNNKTYNSQTLSTSDCKFTLKYNYSSTGTNSDGYQWFGTPLIRTRGCTKCDITFTAPQIDYTYNSDKLTVCLSTTAPSGFVQTEQQHTSDGGFADFKMTGITSIASVQKNGSNVTVTLEFSNQDNLAVLFYFYANNGQNNGQTTAIQIHKIRFYK